MPAVADVAARGWRDDRGESGYIRVRDFVGDLIPLGIHPQIYRNEVIGGATFALIGGELSEDPTGINTGFNLNIPAWSGIGSAAGFRLWYPFYGTAFGVHFNSSYFTTTQIRRFSLGVDGEYWGVRTQPRWPADRNRMSPAPFSSLVDTANLYASVQDLDDGWHMGELVFSQETLQAATWSLRVYGFLVSSKAGYRLPERTDRLYTGTLTTSDVAIPIGLTQISDGRGIRRVWYQNEDAANPHTVIIKYNGTVVRRVVLTARDTAGSSAAVDLNNLGQSGLLTHTADAGAAVNFGAFVSQF